MYFVQDAVKIMAKDLVRTRRYVKKFIMMRANIQAVSLKVQVGHDNIVLVEQISGESSKKQQQQLTQF